MYISQYPKQIHDIFILYANIIELVTRRSLLRMKIKRGFSLSNYDIIRQYEKQLITQSRMYSTITVLRQLFFISVTSTGQLSTVMYLFYHALTSIHRPIISSITTKPSSFYLSSRWAVRVRPVVMCQYSYWPAHHEMLDNFRMPF